MGDLNMLRKGLVALCMAGLLVLASPVLADDCTACKDIAAKGEGFCTSCNEGAAFGVKMSSKKLYDAVAGQTVEVDKVTCEGCKKALAENGVCETCKAGAADGKVYSSMAAYRLAKGKPVAADKEISCEACAKAAKGHGYCDSCGAGFVANRTYTDKESYQAALTAHETLTRASLAAKKCEGCAVAMVKDGECEACKIQFKDGKPDKT
jgi:hypothetical protein